MFSSRRWFFADLLKFSRKLYFQTNSGWYFFRKVSHRMNPTPKMFILADIITSNTFYIYVWQFSNCWQVKDRLVQNLKKYVPTKIILVTFFPGWKVIFNLPSIWRRHFLNFSFCFFVFFQYFFFVFTYNLMDCNKKWELVQNR